MQPKVEKLIVAAVHGIGDQIRFATIQQVLGQFSQYHGKAAAVRPWEASITRSSSPRTTRRCRNSDRQ